jgi:uncharacterized small protein (DUF1192 family)
MDEDDLMPAKKPTGEIVVGEDLSRFSVEELTIRLGGLDEEKIRTEEMIKQKKAQSNLAENLFKTDG